MTTNILISVVTITYRHEKYILETIKGVLNQKYNGPIEFIIANDKSPDKTNEIITNYFNKHKVHSNIEIKYTCHEQNKGMMSNLIWALEQAKGKYVALCEGDDYWTDSLKLQKQVDFLEENPEYTFSMGRVDALIDKTGRFFKIGKPKIYKKNGTYTLKDYMKFPFSQTSSFVFRNSKEPLPDWYQKVHAGDYSIVVIKTGKGKIRYHRELFSIYRINEKSITNSTSYKNSEIFLETIKNIQNYLGKDYDVICKIIWKREKLEIKKRKCNNLLCKIFYHLNIKLINIIIKYI